MKLSEIADIVLDESSSPVILRAALDAFVAQCSAATGIYPDCSFDAWAGDAMLGNGVAINPQAAAHCVIDYTRSVVFLRGTYAALTELVQRFPDTTLQVLYAGCGPFATLLLPLLTRLEPGALDLTLLDYHSRSLASVKLLLAHFKLQDHSVKQVEADASCYMHPHRLHLVVAETMQKSLEQEPQFAVTANLAPQLHPAGIFIPERIDVSLSLADLPAEQGRQQATVKSGASAELRRYPMGRIFSLSAASAQDYALSARPAVDGVGNEVPLAALTVPEQAARARYAPALFTQVSVFGRHQLDDYEAEITLPELCQALRRCQPGERYRAAYQLGPYPRFVFTRLAADEVLPIP